MPPAFLINAFKKPFSPQLSKRPRFAARRAEAEAEILESWDRARGTSFENEFTPPPGGDAKDTIGGLHD